MKPIEISILLTIACHFYKLDHDENYKNDIIFLFVFIIIPIH